MLRAPAAVPDSEAHDRSTV